MAECRSRGPGSRAEGNRGSCQEGRGLSRGRGPGQGTCLQACWGAVGTLAVVTPLGSAGCHGGPSQVTQLPAPIPSSVLIRATPWPLHWSRELSGHKQASEDGTGVRGVDLTAGQHHPGHHLPSSCSPKRSALVSRPGSQVVLPHQALS